MVETVDINTNDPEIKKYIIKFLRKNTKLVTKEFIKSGNMPDIEWIQIYSQD